jgi:parallel beta-helix repeat protein
MIILDWGKNLKIPAILLLLMICLSSYPISGISNNNMRMIYVDDDNINGPWDGTQQHPYDKIQDAVVNAVDYDTIIIYPGCYNENIQVSTPIHLIGLDKETTIISANTSSDFLILESVNFSRIENITFSCFINDRFDIIKMVNCSHCTIYNIDIISQTLQDRAIVVNGSFNTIEHVTIKGDYLSGIALFYGAYNTIKNNTIESCNSGIYLLRSHENTVASNKINNCINSIYIEEGNHNRITRNVMNNNRNGVFCSYASRNRIECNDFLENDEHAKFTKLFKKGFLIPNTWLNNYWDGHNIFLMKPIPGLMYIPNQNVIGLFLPWFEFDWQPHPQPQTLG